MAIAAEDALHSSQEDETVYEWVPIPGKVMWGPLNLRGYRTIKYLLVVIYLWTNMWFSRLLPTVEMAIYVDADIVLRKDLRIYIEEADELDTHPLAFLDRYV